jgi:hypothetical protein
MRNQRRPSRVGRPLGPWDRIPAGIRAGIIFAPILFLLFLINSVGIGLFSSTGITAGMVCYPIQILAYAANGFLAGSQARSTHNKATRMVGREHERVRNRRPNYVAQGALAGVVLGIIAILVYFIVGAAANSLIPGLGLFMSIGGASIALFLIVDFAVCVGAGIIGGMIYNHFD